MSFDEDLFQPHVSDRADYMRRRDMSIEEGYHVISPVFGHWKINTLDPFLSEVYLSGIDFVYIVLNYWGDIQFFFRTEEDYSFFLIKFGEELASKENIGYVKI